jgi:hypothetical protein
MANTTITALPAATTPLAGTEVVPIVQGGVTKKVAVSNIGGGSGTVTSVGLSAPAFLSVGGSPVTSSGTLALTYSGTALPVANGGTGQTSANAALNGFLPSQSGQNGKVLSTDGTNTTWTAVTGTGTVTSVALSAPAFLTVSGSPVTASGTLALSYSGTALPVANGGTGATSATAAFDALAPTQTGNSGKYLTTNGSTTSWGTVSGSGTVTSVAQSFTGGIVSVGGSPITTSGTLALTVAGTSGGVPYFSSGTTWASSAVLAANALVVGGGAGAAPATVTTGTGVVTALGVATGTAGAFVVNGGALGTPASGTVTNLTGTASININGTVGATTPTTGVFTTATAQAAATQDFVALQGRAGGTNSYGVTLTPTTLTASRTLTLPDASGTILQSGTAVTVAQGGTGATTAISAFNALAPSQSGNTGKYLTTDGTNTSWGTVSGGGSPGGSNTQVQFNSSGSFGGSANLTWDGTNVQLGAAGALRFADSDSSNYASFQSPATLAANTAYTLPTALPTANGSTLVATTAGVMSWSAGALSPPTTVEYLVLAGGGGGGGTNSNDAGGGGGGAGGYLTASGFAVSSGTPITVTVGGPGSGGGAAASTQGVSSVFSSITAAGGGRGGGNAWGGSSYAAGAGGSSGGGAFNTAPVSPSPAGQGNAAGSYNNGGGGGGGGAGGAGVTPAITNAGGDGGIAASSGITGSTVTYGGGGGGGAYITPALSGGTGGSSLGGNGGASSGQNGFAAPTANTGSGGGGGGAIAGSNFSGGNGSSGIVIIAYPDTFAPITTISGGLTSSVSTVSRAGYRVYTFTAGTGTIQW